jgi:hypothetical protein
MPPETEAGQVKHSIVAADTAQPQAPSPADAPEVVHQKPLRIEAAADIKAAADTEAVEAVESAGNTVKIQKSQKRSNRTAFVITVNITPYPHRISTLSSG